VEQYHNLQAQFISMLKKMKGIDGSNLMGQQPTLQTQLLLCNSSLMSPLMGVILGH
jgi:hypothetical protein